MSYRDSDVFELRSSLYLSRASIRRITHWLSFLRPTSTQNQQLPRQFLVVHRVYEFSREILASSFIDLIIKSESSGTPMPIADTLTKPIIRSALYAFVMGAFAIPRYLAVWLPMSLSTSLRQY